MIILPEVHYFSSQKHWFIMAAKHKYGEPGRFNLDLDYEPSFCKKYGNQIYDYFAIFISLLDLTTDILVLIEFYTAGRTTFFITSLTILIIAQISYIVAFVSRYGKKAHKSPILFFITLLCIPFVSIVMYIAEKYNIFSNAYNDDEGENITKSPLRKWMDRKLRSHLGFILEATIEAFPQRYINSMRPYFASTKLLKTGQ